MERILIVDDEKEISELIADSLEEENFETIIKKDGEEAFSFLKQEKDFDLIIIDIMMPNMDGYELCRKIRDEVTCPIIFLTAKNRSFDAVVGLEMGADDYITKPFIVEELVARVKSHIRREKRRNRQEKRELICGEIRVRKDQYEAYKKDELINLSTREFELLVYLMENKGKVLEKEKVFNEVWGIDYGDIGTVAVNIKNLRNKIDVDCEYIKTVWGVGYKFVNPKE